MPGGIPFIRGKVRDLFELEDDIVIVTTDRISAFDRMLTTIPCKGEVLNRMSVYWFDHTDDIIPNHVFKQITPRTVLVKNVRPACRVNREEFPHRICMEGLQAILPIGGENFSLKSS